ncbi:MAG: AAA family ATPase [Candidatus Cloacimonadota bacterium]|nr:MAG: AAA family ATPase [Candidatus Cloacimonadota bacterium]
MDYENYYKLTLHPFSSSPDDRFYYDSPQHSKAIVKLTHAAETMVGLAILLGDIGTGKTTLSRIVLDNLTSSDDFEVALLVIIHSEITPIWLLKKIGNQFGVESENDERVEIISNIYQQLTQLKEEGRKAVVLIDEANMLKNKDIMEELRGLLNIQFEEGHLITFILFGLPEMEDYLKLDKPLYQRVSMRIRLDALAAESTKKYISHRLSVAGRESPLFTDEAMDIIHTYSKGKPRMINTICDNVLLEGYLLKKPLIDEHLVRDVVQDLGLSE